MPLPKKYVPYGSKPIQCKYCGTSIGFIKSKKGKWYAIDVFNYEGEYLSIYFLSCHLGIVF